MKILIIFVVEVGVGRYFGRRYRIEVVFAVYAAAVYRVALPLPYISVGGEPAEAYEVGAAYALPIELAGALIEELPEDYRIVTLDGEEYYAVDDTVYRMTAVGGTPYFEVLGQMTGSLAEMYSI